MELRGIHFGDMLANAKHQTIFPAAAVLSVTGELLLTTTEKHKPSPSKRFGRWTHGAVAVTLGPPPPGEGPYAKGR
jgi:hypothetical protein